MSGERVATYEYDALFRRIEKDIDNQGTGVVHNSDAGGSQTLDTPPLAPRERRAATRGPCPPRRVKGERHEHYFWGGIGVSPVSWPLLETTDHAESGGEYSYSDADVLNQFVYGTQYIDEPLVYDRNLDTDNDDDCLEAGDARYFYHQDANFRVVMLTDESGHVVERTRYTAYGEPTLFAGEDANGDELHNLTLVSAVGNPFMHQGLFRDRETLTYQNRFRQYDSKLGRFMQRDPGGYIGGLNTYAYGGENPRHAVDALGLLPCQDPEKQPEKSPCERTIGDAARNEQVLALMDGIEAAGCTPPGIECKEGQKGGRFDDDDNNVYMPDDKEVNVTSMIHELIHAWQQCMFKKGKTKRFDPKDPYQRACAEVQARYCSLSPKDREKIKPKDLVSECAKSILGFCIKNPEKCGIRSPKEGEDPRDYITNVVMPVAFQHCNSAWNNKKDCRNCDGVPLGW